MGLDEPDDDVGPALEAAPAFVEHGACLPDSCRRTQIDAEAPGGPDAFVLTTGADHVPSSLDPVGRSVHSNGAPNDGKLKKVTPGRLGTTGTYHRIILGTVATLAGLLVLLAVLLPFRSHLSAATPALVFVLPALIGVVIGGFVAGAIGAVAGFILYDVFFLPPYDTLTVHSPENWIALVVYVVVVLVLAQVVSQLRVARESPCGAPTIRCGSSSSRRPSSAISPCPSCCRTSWPRCRGLSRRPGQRWCCRPRPRVSSRWPRRPVGPWPATT